MTITNKVSLKSVNGGNTPIADVPDAPTVGTITNTSFDGSVTVAATAAATGGTPTTFTITPTPSTSPATFTGASPVTVSGLSDGTSYTFTAAGVNTTATGPAGSASASTAIVTAGSFFSIATTTVSSSVSSITFSSIPATYTHLQLRWIARSDRAATQDFVDIRLNSDTGANYAAHLLYGEGAAASAAAYVSNTSVGIVFMPAASSTASVFGSGVMDILDYTNTNKYTTTRVLGGTDINGSGRIVSGSGVWMNTAAVTTLTIITDNASTYTQYSKFALYGIKE